METQEPRRRPAASSVRVAVQVSHSNGGKLYNANAIGTIREREQPKAQFRVNGRRFWRSRPHELDQGSCPKGCGDLSRWTCTGASASAPYFVVCPARHARFTDCSGAWLSWDRMYNIWWGQLAGPHHASQFQCRGTKRQGLIPSDGGRAYSSRSMNRPPRVGGASARHPSSSVHVRAHH